MTVGTIYAFSDRCEIVVSPDDPTYVAYAEAELRDEGFEPRRDVLKCDGEDSYVTELTIGSLAIIAGPGDMDKLEKIIMGEVVPVGQHR